MHDIVGGGVGCYNVIDCTYRLITALTLRLCKQGSGMAAFTLQQMAARGMCDTITCGSHLKTVDFCTHRLITETGTLQARL